ncbi:glycosyltransferase family 4 protein [Clostridium sp. YIM B02515]|uniref:Glycosyltransferase family 4 protein n=1 Tax=Clostridium rhizosphaerae TaxID=2803861 RepID=A0ABS1T938_9CLOT|nr:glycosyltransferase family 1 protein [Clostridium rhizosphaerae]MBL4935855.1 glycosyltransferase family 4 protein [Clostridium rhizosphaerae]
MRIAIDARGINWYRGTGIGTYTDKVLKYLLKSDSENYYHIYWSGDKYEEFQKENSKILMASKKYHRFFEQNYFPENLRNNNIDIFHVPQNGIGMNDNIDCKKIATIHDLIPYVMPETVGRGYLLKFLKDVPKVIEECNALITVSERSKQDILKFFPIDEDKVFVTPLAADDKYKPLDKEKCKNLIAYIYGINNPFILYIGGFSPRKNVKALITAFSKIYKKLDKNYDLVIVGATRDQGQYLSEFSGNLELSSKIKFTGYAPEEHLPILYNASEAFVYPSLYEGFGLPPLEAMNCGTPVITSNITSIPEVVGDAGLLINPYDETELMESLIKLLNDDKLKTYYSIKGLERAKNFSWEKTSKNTLEVYKKVYEFQEIL